MGQKKSRKRSKKIVKSLPRYTITEPFTVAVAPELMTIIDSLIPEGRSRNDLVVRLLATHPVINRPDLSEVPRKSPGRRRQTDLASVS